MLKFTNELFATGVQAGTLWWFMGMRNKKKSRISRRPETCTSGADGFFYKNNYLLREAVQSVPASYNRDLVRHEVLRGNNLLAE